MPPGARTAPLTDPLEAWQPLDRRRFTDSKPPRRCASLRLPRRQSHGPASLGNTPGPSAAPFLPVSASSVPQLHAGLKRLLRFNLFTVFSRFRPSQPARFAAAWRFHTGQTESHRAPGRVKRAAQGNGVNGEHAHPDARIVRQD